MLQRQAGRLKPALLALALGSLIVADFYCYCAGHTPCELPPAYRHISAADQPFGILNLPGGHQSYHHCYMLYATMHGYSIVQGALPRKVSKSLQDWLEYNDLAEQKAQLTANKVNYVVLHKKLAEPLQRREDAGLHQRLPLDI